MGHSRTNGWTRPAPGSVLSTGQRSDTGGSSCGRDGDEVRHRRASASAQLRPRGGSEQWGSGEKEEKLTASTMGRPVGAGEVRGEQGDGGDLGDPRRKKRSGPVLRCVGRRVSQQRGEGEAVAAVVANGGGGGVRW